MTNISEDHLDAYDGFADYAGTKRTIAHHQSADDILIVNRDDEEAWRVNAGSFARIVPFGIGRREEPGMWVDGTRLVWQSGTDMHEIAVPENPALTGSRQLANAA